MRKMRIASWKCCRKDSINTVLPSTRKRPGWSALIGPDIIPASKAEGGKPQSFDFLGFTHYWGRSRTKKWVIKRKTAKGRFARAVNAVFHMGCRDNRHKNREEQNRKLTEKLRGHYQYYGITGNSKALKYFYREVEKSWHYWLGRRSQRGLYVLGEVSWIVEATTAPTTEMRSLRTSQ